MREDTLSGLEGLGIAVDRQRNRSPERSARLISTDTSSTTVLVMPTNEELAIAQAAWAFV